MYQTKQIHYKAIFKTKDQSETVEYKAKGLLVSGQQNELSFQANQETIQIIYDEKGVLLKHGDSCLRFEFQKDVWNDYQLPYGQAYLKTRLLKFEANDQCLKMKYELSDQQGLISKVYILITMLPYQS